MLIHELAAETNITAKTIRYYEAVGLMPPPRRAANNYRYYTPAAVDRLRFIASARRLGFALSDVGSILAARDAGSAPCDDLLGMLADRLTEIDRRIACACEQVMPLQHLMQDDAVKEAAKTQSQKYAGTDDRPW